MATTQARPVFRQLTGTVISSGLMQKTVKVCVSQEIWNSHLRRKFTTPQHLLVHDPRTSLLTGDVIRLTPGWRVSKHIRHVVTEIVAPFGKRIEERPAVMTRAELEREREKKEVAKRRMREEKVLATAKAAVAAAAAAAKEAETKAAQAAKLKAGGKVLSIRGKPERKKGRKVRLKKADPAR